MRVSGCRWTGRILLLAGALLLAAPVASVAQDGKFVTGTEWTKSKPETERAFMLGVANLMSAEHKVQAASRRRVTDRQSAIPRLWRAASKLTIDEAIAIVDKWYTGNPDKLGETVIGVIWLTLVKEPVAR
jgi:hypothetical protein